MWLPEPLPGLLLMPVGTSWTCCHTPLTRGPRTVYRAATCGALFLSLPLTCLCIKHGSNTCRPRPAWCKGRGPQTMRLTDKAQGSPFWILLFPAMVVFLSQKGGHAPCLLPLRGSLVSYRESPGPCRGPRDSWSSVPLSSWSCLWRFSWAPQAGHPRRPTLSSWPTVSHIWSICYLGRAWPVHHAHEMGSAAAWEAHPHPCSPYPH